MKKQTMKFNERFNINVSIDIAKNRFINRCYNEIFSEFFYKNIYTDDSREKVKKKIATELGQKYEYLHPIEDYVKNDFFNCILAIECFYKLISHLKQEELDQLIEDLLIKSEVDIGIRWNKGIFINSGAKLLDDELVNKPLAWLREKKYESVLKPYSKGLKILLKSIKDDSLLSDVVTDIYEALEALAKIINNNDKDLSSNAELFIKNIKVSKEYKKLLKEYIAYAQNYRHAIKEGKGKPVLNYKECESFVYLTGIFLRLATKSE